jgi:hypothetical protein
MGRDLVIQMAFVDPPPRESDQWRAPQSAASVCDGGSDCTPPSVRATRLDQQVPEWAGVQPAEPPISLSRVGIPR